MKKFSEWLTESINQAVIERVKQYFHRSAHMDDDFDVTPLIQELGISPTELDRIVGLINQQMQRAEPWIDQRYTFRPDRMTVFYSSADI